MAVFFTIRNKQLIRYVVCLVIARPLQHALPLSHAHTHARTAAVSVVHGRRAVQKKTGTKSCGVKVFEKCDRVRDIFVFAKVVDSGGVGEVPEFLFSANTQ